MNESQVLDALAALAEPTRLRMFRHLVRSGDDGAPAGEIGAAVGSSSSRSSFHLSTLARAGLISSEKRSRQVIYRADFAAAAGLLGYLVQDCCAGHPEVVRCCAGG